MFLLDTDVLSWSAPDREPPPRVQEWARAETENLFLSTITVAEIETGIATAVGKGALRKADRLASWLEAVFEEFAGHILAFDLPASRNLGRLAEAARLAGHHPGFPDLAIAAIAQHHGYTVATRNTRHFKPMGIPVLDPFAPPPQT